MQTQTSKTSKRRPSVASVLATVALFVGLGSVAVAAPLITGKDIKNGSVAKQDLKKKLRSIGKTYVDYTPADVTTSLTRTLEVRVPRGNYTAHADLEMHADDAEGEGECRLRSGGNATPTLLGYTGYMSIADSPNNIEQRFVSLGGAFKTNGGVVELACKGADIESPITGDLVVTRVGGIAGL